MQQLPKPLPQPTAASSRHKPNKNNNKRKIAAPVGLSRPNFSGTVKMLKKQKYNTEANDEKELL